MAVYGLISGKKYRLLFILIWRGFWELVFCNEMWRENLFVGSNQMVCCKVTSIVTTKKNSSYNEIQHIW